MIGLPFSCLTLAAAGVISFAMVTQPGDPAPSTPPATQPTPVTPQEGTPRSEPQPEKPVTVPSQPVKPAPSQPAPIKPAEGSEFMTLRIATFNLGGRPDQRS
jgi:hypothetical protein